MDIRERKSVYVVGVIAAFLICAGLVSLTLLRARERAKAMSQSVPPEQPAQPAVASTVTKPSRYRQMRAIDTGQGSALALAAGAGGDIYVARAKTIQHYNTGGNLIATRAWLGPEPTGLAVAEDGTLLVVSQRNIALFAKTGEGIARWGLFKKNVFLTSLAMYGSDVWVADAGSRVVYHYTRHGSLIGRLGGKDAQSGAPGLVVPSPHLDVAMAADGTLWVANPGRHQLEAYRDGKLVTSWGKTGMAAGQFGGCCNPADFALMPDGCFVTAEKGLRRVSLYRKDGTFDCLIAGPDAFSKGNGGLDVAADKRGRIYVLDGGTVKVFTEHGK